MTGARRGTGVRAMLGPAVVAALSATVCCAVVSAVLDGLAGVAAAVLAGGLVLAFLLAGQLPVAQAARGRRGVGAFLLLVGYLSRVILLLVVWVLVVDVGFPDPAVFGADLVVIALGWTAGTVWSFLRWQPAVVDVEPPSDRAPTGR